jgi:3-dehydroquinate synthase
VSETFQRFSARDGLRTIAVGDAIASALPEALRACNFFHKLIVISDRTVASRLFVPLKAVLEKGGFDVVAAFAPEGEHRKHLKSTEGLSSLLLEGAIGPGTGVLAFGGGSVADLAGFVAATYQGGLPYVQIPTTLTAQVENLASRRPALNHPQQKDLIAVAHAPCLVWNDLRYLDSLPPRERVSGICTLVARAAGLHRSLFEVVEKRIEGLIRFDPRDIATVVTLAAQASLGVTGDDEARHQNFVHPGDTIGDALQLAGRFRVIRYGEARLLGLMAEAYLARQAGVLGEKEFDRIRTVAQAVPVAFSLGAITPWDVFRVLKYDSKALIRARGIPYLLRIGEAAAGQETDDSQLIDALRWVLEWARGGAVSRPGSSTN